MKNFRGQNLFVVQLEPSAKGHVQSSLVSTLADTPYTGIQTGTCYRLENFTVKKLYVDADHKLF